MTHYKSYLLKSCTQGDQGFFSGYASLFNTPDLVGDVIKPGAFGKAIQALYHENVVPKMLWQHDPARVLGRWENLVEDAQGLYVEGQLFTDLPTAQEAYHLLKRGALDGLSIGFLPMRRTSLTQGGSAIWDLTLLEISLVTFPALPGAKVTRVKQTLFPS